MRVIFASQRIEFTTGYRIDVAKWDADKQRVKNGCTNKLKQSAAEINTDGYVLYDWHTVLFPALQCKNDVALDIHNWVRLKFYTQIYTQLLR